MTSTTTAKLADGNEVKYGSVEGEQYSIPIHPSPDLDYGFYGSTRSTSSSASFESCQSHERYDFYEFFPKKCDSPETWSDFFFEFMGFHSNPMRPTSDGSTSINSAADMRLSMLSNFSTAYNVLSVSLALHIMDNLYSATPQDKSLCSSALIAGMIVGQLAGGALGDVLGRHRAMAFVLVLQVFAAFASSLSCDLSIPSLHLNYSVFHVLAAWRLILGIGCGGVYPLAATLTAESSHSVQDRAKTVAFTFSFQGVGYLAVPLIAWVVVYVLGEESDLAWRILLGIGSVPGIVLTVLRIRSSSVKNLKQSISLGTSAQSEYNGVNKQSSHARLVPASVLDAILREKDIVRKFLGTGGCWLLFDILFYGNTLFEPMALSSAFGTTETVQNAARDSVVIAMIALPGYFVSVYAVGRQSPCSIQVMGFFLMGILFLIIGVMFDVLSGNRFALLAFYGSTFFFSNYGPNATTFILPSVTFSPACRSTLNGICAASGKLGALIGSVFFVIASQWFGQKAIFLACGFLALIGCLITLLCVSPSAGEVDTYNEENLAALTPEERLSHEIMGTSNIKMVVVYSRPSLVDYNSDPGS